MRTGLILGWAAVLAFALSACGGGYYKVMDPTTQKVYYTSDLDEEDNGAVRLLDGNTGSTVTLQNSEVTEISPEEFKARTQKMDCPPAK